ncbi:hypothetical protein [Christiangramia fulva]|nr:hypothetical protein [Christiangramia fulva]
MTIPNPKEKMIISRDRITELIKMANRSMDNPYKVARLRILRWMM